MNQWKKLLSIAMAISLMVTSVSGVGMAEGEPVIIAEEMAFIEAADEELPALMDPLTEEQPEGITIALSASEAEVYAGETIALTAAVTGASADDIVWSSSDEKTATVTNGVVTGVNSGYTVITASIGGVSAQCSVKVSVRLTGFKISPVVSRLQPGQYMNVSAYPQPMTARFEYIEWTSDDENVVTVVRNYPESWTSALITAVAPGKTNVRLTCGDVSSVYEIEVLPATLTSLTMDRTEATINIGEQLMLSVTPNEHAELGEVVWSSGADVVASVENGVVTGRSKGIVKITAASGDVKAVCTVTVDVPLTGLKMNIDSATLLNGSDLSLKVVPNQGAEIGEVVWSSSDDTVVTVENGYVKAVGVGEAVITASSGGFEATCALQVYEPLTAITLSRSEKMLEPGSSFALNAQPNEGAQLENVQYVSDNEAVATVVNGVVTAVAPGTAVITVSSGNVSAQCTVTVRVAVEITGEDHFVYAGETLDMEYIYHFDDEEALSAAAWSVDDPAIAEIDPETGVLTGSGKGIVRVTVECTGVNGNVYKASADVQVGIRATGIEIGMDDLLLDLNASHQMTAKLLPEGVEGDVEWSSSDPAVAEISADGIVTGHAIGTAVITAKHGEFTDQCVVRVEIIPQRVDQYSRSMVLYPNQKGMIRYEIRPLNATNRTMTWSSSDNSIAKVSDSGVVTAVKSGKCEITGVSSNGIEIRIPVTVVAKGKAVTSIKLNASSKTIERTKTYQLKATVSPSKAADKSVVWASEFPEIATVDANGLVTAHAQGQTRIMAVTSSGVIKTCKITVAPLSVSKVKLDMTKATMYSGDDLQLDYALTPADADDLSVKWTSSKASVATVDENGVVTAHKSGSATITCTSASGKKATCKVTVKAVAPVMDVTKHSMGTGDSFSIDVSYKPATDAPMQLTWYSSKPSVADVDENGVVTAYKNGSAKIYCKTQYGATDYVTVTVKAISPVMDYSKYTLATDESFRISVEYSPATQQDMGLTWKSSKPSVADVDENGVVTGYSAGSAKITCTTKYGKTDSVTVTVKDPVPAMNITKYTLATDMTYQIGVSYSPATSQDTGMLWESSNEDVATVDANGLVTAVSAGTAKITCTTKHGKTDSCTITVKDPVPVMDVTARNIAVHMTYPIGVSYTPATQQDPQLQWRSSNEAAATVDENGVVTALAVGSTIITCTTKYGTVDSCTITVKNPSPVMSVSKADVAVETPYPIHITYSPETDQDMGLVWRSADETIATVDQSGVVTGHAAGSVKITCETKDGLTDSCTITVKIPQPKMASSKKSIVAGDSWQAEVQYTPTTENDMELQWRSSDEKVATVDEFGVVTGHASGSAKITCTTKYGHTASCTVTVKMPTPVMDRTKHTMYTGETFEIPVSFNPETNADVALTWKTSKPSVATVNAEGMITAISKGTATITCSTSDGKKDTCKITVKPMPVSELVLSNPYGDLAVGGKYTLDAVCYPDNAASKEVVWKSGDTSIAKVNTTTGLITCLKAGTVDIYAKANDGSGVIAQITVNVRDVEIDEFTLDVSELVIEAGNTYQVNMTLNGELNGVAPIWTSDDERIASVDSNGLITAVGSGGTVSTSMTVIRCTIGSQSRTVVVAVPKPGDSTYRFLIAGEYTNSKVSGYLNFAVNGLTNVDAAFDMANIEGSRYLIERLNNPSEGTLMNTINTFFDDADSDDVSVLYLMSHGLNKDGEYRWTIAGSKDYITEKELTAALEKIKGEVVLIMVSCYSGQYIENYTTSTKKLQGVVSTVNGSRPGNKKISIIASQAGDMTGPYTDFPKDKSYDFFCRLFSKALGWDQESASPLDEMYADLDDDGVITLLELATYLGDTIQQDIDDHVDQYGEQSVANTAKNKGKQKVEYYLTSPDLVIYSRGKAPAARS